MNRTNTTTGEDVTQTAEIDFTNERYTTWIESLSTRYRENQIKAAVAVNTEMLKFYFGLGRDIVVMGKDQPWGSGFLKRVSVDLKMKMPGTKGIITINGDNEKSSACAAASSRLAESS